MIAKLLRIFVDEDDRIDGRPLHLAVIEALRTAGFTGATVLKGIEGFGGSRRIRAARVPDSAIGLPVLIEVIDDASKVTAFMPALRAMMTGGLITLENIEVMHVVGDRR